MLRHFRRNPIGALIPPALLLAAALTAHAKSERRSLDLARASAAICCPCPVSEVSSVEVK